MVDVGYFRGAVYWDIGLVLYPEDSCIEFLDFDSIFPDYNTYGQYCCNRWIQLPEATQPDNTCLEFTSNVEYYNQTMSLANLTMKYYFHPGSDITIDGINFTSPLPFLQYDHTVNYAFDDCQGTTDAPESECIAEIDFNDAVYAFYADVTGYTAGTWHAIAGAVEYRDGIIMRNGSNPFTPQNSCYQYSFDSSVGGSKAFDKTVKSRSNSCCSKWQNPLPSTTPSTQTTTSQQSGGTKYAVSLQVANSTNFGQDTLATLNATLQVTSSNYVFTVTSYNSFMQSNYHVYIFANQFLTEDCIGTSAQTCNLPQTDGQSYPWFLSTSFAPDGFRLFTTSAKNGTLIIPELSAGNEKCYFVVNPYNYAYPPLYVQASICLQ